MLILISDAFDPSLPGQLAAFGEVTDDKERMSLHRKTVGGSGDGEILAEFAVETWPVSWHPSGEVLLVGQEDPQNSDLPNLLSLSLAEPGDPQPWQATSFVEYDASFSPDGRWVAYGSDESGEFEIYVAPFPGPGRKWQVSVGNGGWPVWRGDGSEILYVDITGRMMAVSVEERGNGLTFGQPEALFQFRAAATDSGYAVTADGERFLVIEPAENLPPEPVTVVVNWPAAIEAQR